DVAAGPGAGAVPGGALGAADRGDGVGAPRRGADMNVDALDARGERNVVGVHPDQVRVVRRAATGPLSFTVTEVLRTLARQRALKASGASWPLNSRHLTGHAADLADKVTGQVRWDWPLYERLGQVMKQAARA